jgi:Tol biopolymer transport system component
MNSDGTGQTRITFHPAADSGPVWSSDSRYLLFTSNRDGDNEIYRMQTDGSNATNLTRAPGSNDRTPAWD